MQSKSAKKYGKRRCLVYESLSKQDLDILSTAGPNVFTHQKSGILWKTKRDYEEYGTLSMMFLISLKVQNKFFKILNRFFHKVQLSVNKSSFPVKMGSSILDLII